MLWSTACKHINQANKRLEPFVGVRYVMIRRPVYNRITPAVEWLRMSLPQVYLFFTFKMHRNEAYILWGDDTSRDQTIASVLPR